MPGVHLMKNRRAFLTGLPLLSVIFLAACSGSAQPGQAPAAPAAQGESSAPTLAPTAVPEYHPSGVLVDPGNGASLNYYDINGQLVKTFAAPRNTTLDPQNVCLTGSGTSGNSSVAVVFQSLDPQAGLVMTDGIQSSSLRKTDTFFALACVPGQAALAFSEVSIENEIPRSSLYAESTDNLGSLSPVLQSQDAETQTVFLPVAVTAAAGNPKGIWYTHSAWGVGGADLIFPITRGLDFYDLSTKEKRNLLDGNRNFQGISPDRQFAGSVDFRSDGDLSMRATELVSGRSIDFPLKAGSKRGAGYAVFSPDNTYIAWMEAGGSLTSDPPDFLATVRVGSLANGTIEAEVDATAAAQVLKLERIAFLKPVGWLDSQALLIEARSADWQQAYLLRFDLQSQSIAVFSSGSFLGFSYS